MQFESRRHYFTRLQEWPFNSDTKVMTVKCQDQHEQVIYFIKGAIERVLALCSRYYYRGTAVELTPKQSVEFFAAAEELARSGKESF